MKRKVKKLLSFLVATAMIISTVLPSYRIYAATTPKLNAAKKTIAVGNKTTLKVLNLPEGSGCVWKSSSPKVASVTQKGVVTAKKKGTATITCSVKAPKKTYTLRCRLKVSTGTVVATQEKLNKALQNPKIKTITVKTALEKTFTIPEGNYGGKDIIVNSPKAEVINNGVFHSVTIQSIKPGTWTERARGNRIQVTAKKARVVVEKTAQVASLLLNRADSDIAVQVDGRVEKVSVNQKSAVNMTVNGTVNQVAVEAAVNLTLGGNTQKISVTVTSQAQGAQISASVTVTISASADIKLDLEKGAEGSTVTTTEESVKTTIKNETEEKVEVTTPSGSGAIDSGKEGTSTEVAEPDVPQPSSEPSGNTGGGNTSGGGGGSSTPSVVHPSSISLNKQTAMLLPGKEVTLMATVAPANANNKSVTWSTSNSQVATVSNGIVTAVSAGSVTIMAKTVDGGKTASCTVTVYENSNEMSSASASQSSASASELSSSVSASESLVSASQSSASASELSSSVSASESLVSASQSSASASELSSSVSVSESLVSASELSSSVSASESLVSASQSSASASELSSSVSVSESLVSASELSSSVSASESLVSASQSSASASELSSSVSVSESLVSASQSSASASELSSSVSVSESLVSVSESLVSASQSSVSASESSVSASQSSVSASESSVSASRSSASAAESSE